MDITVAHGVQSGAWLLIAVPALSALLLLTVGKRGDKWAHLLGAFVPSRCSSTPSSCSSR